MIHKDWCFRYVKKIGQKKNKTMGYIYLTRGQRTDVWKQVQG